MHFSSSLPAGYGRLVAALALVTALVGCAVQPAGGPSSGAGVVAGQPGTPLDDNLSGFLAQAPAGAVLSLAQSPWGNQVEVIAEETYLAASGRECRRLQVMRTDASQVTHALACATSQGWETRRLITEEQARGGRR
ncbi:DVU3141 family protein [Halomonas mongoliensis]|uniref:DVU3141 family protein n=1 Tax=Halomonas mongoliensis TaxID=321265 RepID=UPI00403AC027